MASVGQYNIKLSWFTKNRASIFRFDKVEVANMTRLATERLGFVTVHQEIYDNGVYLEISVNNAGVSPLNVFNAIKNDVARRYGLLLAQKNQKPINTLWDSKVFYFGDRATTVGMTSQHEPDADLGGGLVVTEDKETKERI